MEFLSKMYCIIVRQLISVMRKLQADLKCKADALLTYFYPGRQSNGVGNSSSNLYE